jgi:addiction module RelE/StbE family toxin
MNLGRDTVENKFTVKYTPVSQRDLLSILDYISLDDPVAALNQVDDIEHAVDNLEAFPYSGTESRDENIRIKGYRYLIVNEFNVFYTVDEKRSIVRIHRILSAKQNSPDYL